MTKQELGKQAMLVSVNIVNGGLLGERKNRQASELVQTTYNVTSTRAKASTYLIDRTHKSVKQVVAASQRVREVMYKYTLPWGDEKMRLVTTSMVNQLRVKLQVALEELDECRAVYENVYPDLVQTAQFDLGPLFDPMQYPPQNKIKSLFETRVAWWPFPETGHFVADVSRTAANEAKRAMENEIEQRLMEATYDMVKRARKVVAKFIEKVDEIQATMLPHVSYTSPDKWEMSGVIRDSLIDNIAETADLIERMNITNSEQIQKVVKDLQRLCVYSAAYWRNQPSAFGRDKPKALITAQEILTNLDMIDLRDKEITEMVTGGGEYMD